MLSSRRTGPCGHFSQFPPVFKNSQIVLFFLSQGERPLHFNALGPKSGDFPLPFPFSALCCASPNNGYFLILGQICGYQRFKMEKGKCVFKPIRCLECQMFCSTGMRGSVGPQRGKNSHKIPFLSRVESEFFFFPIQ